MKVQLCTTSVKVLDDNDHTIFICSEKGVIRSAPLPLDIFEAERVLGLYQEAIDDWIAFTKDRILVTITRFPGCCFEIEGRRFPTLFIQEGDVEDYPEAEHPDGTPVVYADLITGITYTALISSDYAYTA